MPDTPFCTTAQPPRTWQKVVVVALAFFLPYTIWRDHGWALCLVALLVYGGVFLTWAFNFSGPVAWSGRHVALDALFIVPFVFLAVANLTALPLVASAGISLAAGAVLVPVVLRRSR